MPGTQAFFSEAFDWTFEDFGPDYCAFAGQGLDGGFYRSELYSSTLSGTALLVFYSADLVQKKVSRGCPSPFKKAPPPCRKCNEMSNIPILFLASVDPRYLRVTLELWRIFYFFRSLAPPGKTSV